jgi:hypothetical protein
MNFKFTSIYIFRGIILDKKQLKKIKNESKNESKNDFIIMNASNIENRIPVNNDLSLLRLCNACCKEGEDKVILGDVIDCIVLENEEEDDLKNITFSSDEKTHTINSKKIIKKLRTVEDLNISLTNTDKKQIKHVNKRLNKMINEMDFEMDFENYTIQDFCLYNKCYCTEEEED